MQIVGFPMRRLVQYSFYVHVLICYLRFQGHLSGYGIEEQLPTVAVVTHYDAFGIAPVRSILFVPIHEKTKNLEFLPGPTQTGQYNHRKMLEA